MSWVNLGPTNIGGCMFGIAIDPTSDNQLLAVSASGGCWKLRYQIYSSSRISIAGDPFSPDIEFETGYYLAASQWTPLTDRLPLLFMTAIGLCERHPQTVYCVTGHYNMAWPTQVWRSDDGGASWTQRSNPGFSLAYRLAVDQDDPDRIFVAARNGLQQSTDGGVTWSTSYAGVAYDVTIDPDDANIVYAGIEDVGVVKTTNARPSFTSGLGLPLRPLWLTVLSWSRASAPPGKTIRVALGAGEAPERTVVAKLDQEVFVNHEAGRGSWDSKGTWGGAGQGDWDHVVAADPYDRNVVLAGAQDLYRTADGGSSWTQVAGYDSATHPDQQFLVFDRRRRGVVYLANDGGVWGSRDGGARWFDLNDGLVSAELFHVGISGASAMADMYHAGLIGSIRLPTTRWAGLEGGSWEFSNVYGDPVRPGRFFVFHEKLGLRRLFRVSVPVIEASEWEISIRWRDEEAGDFNRNVGDFPPRSIEFDRRPGSNTIVVGTTDGRVMRALNGDSASPTWQSESGINARGSAVVGLAFAPSLPARYYAICSSGAVFRKEDINSSNDWIALGSASSDVSDLAVNAADENRLYALHDGGLETSPDGGQTWTSINGAGSAMLPSRGLRSVFADPNDPTLVIVGAVGGVFASTSGGATWVRYDYGLPNAEIRQVFMVNGTLYAATVGRGLWERLPLLRDFSTTAAITAVPIRDMIIR